MVKCRLKNIYLSSSPFVVILDLSTHADMAEERRVFLAELRQNKLPVSPAQVFWCSHEENVTAARSQTLGFAMLWEKRRYRSVNKV